MMKIAKRIVLLIAVLFSLPNMVLIVMFFVTFIKNDYLYLTADYKVLPFSVILLALPILHIVYCVYVYRCANKKKITTVLSLMLAVFFVIVSVVLLPINYFLSFGHEGVYSATDDYAHYGEYDAFAVPVLQNIGAADILPESSLLSECCRYSYKAKADTTSSDLPFCRFVIIELYADFRNVQNYSNASDALKKWYENDEFLNCDRLRDFEREYQTHAPEEHFFCLHDQTDGHLRVRTYENAEELQIIYYLDYRNYS